MLNATVAGLPSPTGLLLVSVAVGTTLFTVTTVVYSLKPPSLSMIRPLTVYEPLSSKVQLVLALLAAVLAYVAEARLPLRQLYA